MENDKDQGGAVRGEAVAELPARRFVHVTGFLDADYVEFKAGETFGGGVFGGVERESKHYTRDEAEECVRNGAWREVGAPVAAAASDYEEVLADHRRLVRELDVALNGEAGAAKQASLGDIVRQVKREGIRSASVSARAADAPSESMSVRDSVIALIERAQKIAPSLATCTYELTPIQVAWIIGQSRLADALDSQPTDRTRHISEWDAAADLLESQADISADEKETISICAAVLRRIARTGLCRAATQPTVAAQQGSIADDALRYALQEIVNTVPAHNGEGGGFFVEHHGPDAEYLGAQQINPDDIIQEILSIANEALVSYQRAGLREGKWMPAEATEAMVHAAQDVPAPRPYGAVYRAMYRAAPGHAVDGSPTVSAVLAELRADIRELQNNLEAFGEYSQETARVALDGAVDALDEVAEKYAAPQQEGSEAGNGNG